MIVPQFWAEAQRPLPSATGRQPLIVRRLGWSDASPAEAQAMAEQRVDDAVRRITAGEPLLRREPKTAYNGAAGVPIREEILGRDGNAIITRNGYGARCLNTPDVLFADIDFAPKTGGAAFAITALVLVLASVLIGGALDSKRLGFALALLSLLLTPFVARGIRVAALAVLGGPESLARRRIEAFMEQHADWKIRLYRTPAGFRVLALHARFDPSSAEVADCFRALGVDPVYAAMCRNQHCFRARLTPKPWRIGISDHLRPRPGVWPVAAERLPARQRWVCDYEAAAATYAACRFVESYGTGRVDPVAHAVRALHDEITHALTNRPIA